MLNVIFERQAYNETVGIVCKVKLEKNVIPDFITIYLATSASVEGGTGFIVADSAIVFTQYVDGFIIRVNNAINIGRPNRNYVKLFGNYNYDGIKIIDSFGNRVEIRNEYGVLITDNGKPWVDGTYPPDAKNRAGLAGLHAAPAVIKPELETALMGDETNEERVQE